MKYILSGFDLEYEDLVVNVMHHVNILNVQEIQHPFEENKVRLQQQHTSNWEHSTNVVYRGDCCSYGNFSHVKGCVCGEVSMDVLLGRFYSCCFYQ